MAIKPMLAVGALLISAGMPCIAAAAAEEGANAAALEELIRRYVADRRTEAQSSGLHDVSAAAFLKDIEDQRSLLKALRTVTPEGLSKAQDIDRRFLIGVLDSGIRLAETRRIWENDPALYVPSRQVGLALDPAASGSATERAGSVAAMLQELPARLAHGRNNLERPPQYFTEEAIFQTKGTIATLRERASALAAEAGGGAGRDLNAAAGTALSALGDYLEFLQSDLLPRSDGDWALGEETYNYILRHRWFMDADAGEILERGLKAFEGTETLARKVAGRIDPEKHWIEVYEDLKGDHPEGDELKSAYQSQIDAARQFVIEHRIVTLPEYESVITVDTPPAMRRSSPYGTFDSVGPFDEGLQGRLVLTPVEDWMTPGQRSERLRSHHYAWIPIIAVHEAYPGHHVQALKVRENPRFLRRVAHESIFSEGWGLYTEELMYQLGFLEGDDVRLTQLRNRLWRAARVILDVRLHTGQIEFDEAVDFLVDKVRFDPYSAELEVGMYIRRPTYVLGYLIGMQEIAAIRDDYFEAYGKPVPLSGFYDRLLRVGAIPPALVREALFQQGSHSAQVNRDRTPDQ